MTAGSLVDCTIVVAVDDTLYLYPVTQSDDDSVQEILTDELVKVSVWIVTPSGLHIAIEKKRINKRTQQLKLNNQLYVNVTTLRLLLFAGTKFTNF